MHSVGELADMATGGAVALSERPEAELDLLIREARRRQRRRRLAIAAVVVTVLGGAAVTRVAVLPGFWAVARSVSQLPSLGPHGECPVTFGFQFSSPDFSGPVLGRGPVRVLVGNGGDPQAGRIELGLTSLPRWRAIETIWLAIPGYNGPFKVSGIRLGHPGAIAVQPGGDGLNPGRGPLVVPAGPTLNTFPNGYRTAPGSTWVRSSGCYVYHVSGRGFTEDIVFDAFAHIN